MVPEILSIATPVRISGLGGDVLLVSDYDNRAVLKLDTRDLSVTGKISVAGRPTGLAWLGNEVFVGNESKGSVEVYDQANGQLLRTLGGGDGVFGLPNGIAIDSVAGIVFVVDSAARAVKQFHLDGSSAGPDIGSGLLAGPTTLTVDTAKQLLFISDYGAPLESFGDTPSIQILNYSGSLHSRIEGTIWDFDRPQGLSFNGEGKLFVAEGLAGKILIFDVSNLAGIARIGELGNGELKMPLDLYIDPVNKDLYTTSSLGAEVVVYAGGGA